MISKIYNMRADECWEFQARKSNFKNWLKVVTKAKNKNRKKQKKHDKKFADHRKQLMSLSNDERMKLKKGQELRRDTARKNAADRRKRTIKEQIKLCKSRRGSSKKELARLYKLLEKQNGK